MDSHSRSASPREPMRPQHKPPSPPSSPTGFDNRAYTHDDADPNHNDSFTSNGQQHNGHTKEPNGVPDAKTLEAVNLELINLTPKNGNAKKKDVEVDMNAANPYDEYFVPVNEHRKYMRGEKLYVTADKRGEKGGCKRPLCWTLLGLVVAAIVAIIVLAATGILFSSSPTTLEQYNSSIITARALGGGSGHLQHDHNELDQSNHDHSDYEHDDHTHSSPDHRNTDHEEMDHNTEPSEQHGPSTQNNEAHEHSLISEESGESSNIYVPRTLEGELKVDNENFTSDLHDPESNEYREFATTFSEDLKRALFNREDIENGDNEIIIEVVQLREGSIIVTYRIHWKPRSHAEHSEDLLNAKTLKTSLDEYLNKNNRMINVYHIAEDKIITKPVLDVCQINKNGCEYGCEFDERILDFTCTCPHGQIIDMGNPKKCMSVLENTENIQIDSTTQKDIIQQITLRINTEENNPTVTPEPSAEHSFDWQESHHVMPETTTDVESAVNFSNVHSHPTENADENETEKSDSVENPTPEPTTDLKSVSDPLAETKPDPSPNINKSVETEQPQSEPESITEPERITELESEPISEPEAEPKTEFDIKSEINKESSTELEPEPEPEPKAEIEPEPSAEPEPGLTVEPEPEPKSKSELNTESELESNTEPELIPKAEPEPTPKTEPELTPKTELEQEQKTQLELELQTESVTEPNSELFMKQNIGPQPEPHIEPEEEATTTTTPSTDHMDINPTFISPEEPQSEPQPVTESEPIYQPRIELESSQSTQKLESTAANTQSALGSIQVTQDEPIKTTEAPSTSLTVEINTNSENEHTDEIKSILYTNEGKFEYNPNRFLETTTLKIVMSEPNTINEPFYEPKPELISMLNDNKDVIMHTTTITSDETTTESSDWLEDQVNYNINIKADYQNHTNNKIYANILNNIDKITQQSEQRSLKVFDEDDFMSETTTLGAETQDSVTLFTIDAIAKDNATPETERVTYYESTTKINEDGMSPISNLAVMNNQFMQETIKPMLGTTSATVTKESTNSESDKEHEVVEISKTGKEIESVEHREKSGHENISEISSILLGANALDTNQTTIIITTTTESEPIDHISINEHYHNSEDEKLMEILETKPTPVSNKDVTERQPEEAMDIDFDSISMLYNRSSKSIDNQPEIISGNSSNNKTSSLSEIVTQSYEVTSTENDWLVEHVTEINYEDAMNKTNNQKTTEANAKKIEDLMHHSLVKDDFEPDYLSNLGSGGTKQMDEPLYGMAHDYDNEDSRFKRVNEERSMENLTKDISTEMKINNVPTTSPNVIPITNAPVETTTIRDYIYNTVRNNLEESEITLADHDETKPSEPSPPTSSVLIAAPAPVWEESELDRDISLNTNYQSTEPNKSAETVHMNNDSQIFITTTSITPSNTTLLTENVENRIFTKTEDTELANSTGLNATHLNNLNVTIYEISNHGNGTSTSKTNNAQSAEYEDHETEMNPFLPDIENNKILVKKLQEGHDIELVNLNETQNENAEENHVMAVTQNPMIDTDPAVIPTIAPKTTEEEIAKATDMFPKEFQIYENSRENVTDSVDKNTTVNYIKSSETTQKEVLPISTFFLDTDDLVTSKEPSRMNNMLENEPAGTTVSPIISSPDDYLSVVPIDEENDELLNEHKSENIEALNDITDISDLTDKEH